MKQPERQAREGGADQTGAKIPQAYPSCGAFQLEEQRLYLVRLVPGEIVELDSTNNFGARIAAGLVSIGKR
ncbi:hypothetical protein ACTG2E_23300 [Aeromonas veronii]